MQLEGYVSNLDENLDSKGRVYYTNELGEIVKPNISPLKALKNNLQAFGFNASRWLNETNPESEAYKQKANTLLAIETAPMGIGRAGTQMIASKLAPMFGRKIGQMTAEGIGSGLVGGGVEEIGRAMIDEEKPLDVARRGLIGAGAGATLGGLLGLGAGKIGRNMAKKNLVGNPEAQINFYDDYIEGLNNNAVTKQGFGINDIRGLKAGNYGNLEGETLYNFIGKNAENADKVALNKAQELFNQGVDNESIRQQTGWFKGVDGKWRYEIPDGRLIENPNVWETKNTGFDEYQISKLGDIYDNPELYQAYPKLKDLSILKSDLPDGVGGISTPNSIHIDNSLYSKHNPDYYEQLNKLKQTPEVKRMDEIVNEAVKNGYSEKLDNEYNNILSNTENGKLYNSLVYKHNIPQKVEGWNDDALDTFVHEIQHQIQAIEGFARGGNSSLNPNYKNLAGEVEARLAGARAKLTPEQRQIYNPANESSYLTNYGYDVIPEKQIVEFRNDKNNLYHKLTNNNGVVDLTNSFSKNPTIAEVKAHIQNLINNGIKYDTLSPDWKIDIIGGKAKADHIVKSSQYGKMNKSKVNRHNKYIASIEDLINNSTYSNSKANTKIAKKPNIDTYHYFETNVKIGNKQYKVILNAEQFKGESTIKPQTVHLYDVLEIK